MISIWSKCEKVLLLSKLLPDLIQSSIDDDRWSMNDVMGSGNEWMNGYIRTDAVCSTVFMVFSFDSPNKQTNKQKVSESTFVVAWFVCVCVCVCVCVETLFFTHSVIASFFVSLLVWRRRGKFLFSGRWEEEVKSSLAVGKRKVSLLSQRRRGKFLFSGDGEEESFFSRAGEKRKLNLLRRLRRESLIFSTRCEEEVKSFPPAGKRKLNRKI